MLFVAVLSCRENNETNYSVEKFFDKTQQREIVRQLIPRIEKRFTGLDASKQDAFDRMWLDSCYLAAVNKTRDNRFDYLYIKKDVQSRVDDARVVIGSFKLDSSGAVTSVYQDYISHRLFIEDALAKGQLYFSLHTTGQSLDKYLNRSGHIQWPNEDVKFNYQTEKWEY